MVAFLNPNLLITIFAAQPDLESETSLIHFAKLRSQTFPKENDLRNQTTTTTVPVKSATRDSLERRHLGLQCHRDAWRHHWLFIRCKRFTSKPNVLEITADGVRDKCEKKGKKKKQK